MTLEKELIDFTNWLVDNNWRLVGNGMCLNGDTKKLSINSTYDGKFKFIITEGESVAGPIPATGNTNTRGKFKPDVRTFLSKWVKESPTHHFALGIGHHASTIVKIANYLGIESVVIGE